MRGRSAVRGAWLAGIGVAWLGAGTGAQETRAGGVGETPPESRSAVHLVVRVLDASGEPVTGAAVVALPIGEDGRRSPGRGEGERAEAGGILLVSPSPGRLVATDLPSGRYRLRASALGYAPWERTVELAPGAKAAIVARLDPAPVRLADLVARVRRGALEVPPGHAVDRVRFEPGGAGAAGLGDWLDGLPGVGVRRRGGGGQQVLSVRGSRPEGVLVLLDGLPLNDPLTGAADLAVIPAATLESATLVRGATPEAGPGALGGVLLLRSREPGGTAVAGGMEAGSFARVAADLQARAAGEMGALAVMGRYEESRNDFTYTNRIHPRRPLERRRNADTRSWHGTLAAGLHRLPAAVRFRLDRLEGGAPGRMGTSLFDEARREDSSWQIGLEAGGGAVLSGGAAAGRRRLVYRDPRRNVEARHDVSDLRLQVRVRPDRFSRWEAAGWTSLEAASGDGLSDTPARVAGAFTVARRLGGHGLEARPGLTVDLSDARVIWSPSVALTGRPGREWRLWGRAGRAFRRPTFSDLYFASGHFLRPNPDLQPERIEFDGELGAEWTSGDGRLRARGVAYTRLTRDPIAWLPSSVAVWSPRNLDQLRARGLELDLAVEPVAGWRLEASGTAETSRLGSGSGANPLPYQPPVRARATVERRGGRAAARAELRLVGSRTTSLAGTHRLPGFALLDLWARASLTDVGGVPLELRVGLRNVLDAGYELTALFPEPGRSLEARFGFGPFPRE